MTTFADIGLVNGSGGREKLLSSVESEKITAKSLQRLLERQKYRCALTGRILTPETASADHVKPFADGGENTISNIQIIHADVNLAKGTMTQEDFLAMCREVVDHAGQ